MSDEIKVPWEKPGEVFDQDRAKSYLEAITADRDKAREERDKVQARLKEATDSKKGASAREKELQKENILLKVQMKTGLSDRQIQRLVGDTEEALLEDAGLFAEETGIELRDLIGDVGTPGEEPGADEGQEQPEEPKQFSTNYRTPQGQTMGSHQSEDISGIIENMQI